MQTSVIVLFVSTFVVVYFYCITVVVQKNMYCYFFLEIFRSEGFHLKTDVTPKNPELKTILIFKKIID